MLIKMIGIYGTDREVYFRKDGVCFNFAPKKEFASVLTTGEAADILNHKKFYLDQFNGKDLVIVP